MTLREKIYRLLFATNTRHRLHPHIGWLVLAGFIGCASSPSTDSGGGGCGGTNFVYPVANNAYVPGSYAGRLFLTPGNHLGEDIALSEGTAVQSVGDGRIVVYRPASGYGELVVVIEHDLQNATSFIAGDGKTVATRHILTIYGHLRTASVRGGKALIWHEGDLVKTGDVVGYVNDGAHNGDGGTHLHFGVRLANVGKAQAMDPSAWFRGYDTSTNTYRSEYTAGSTALVLLGANCVANSSVNNTLSLLWQPFDKAPTDSITLSGKTNVSGVSDPWRVWANTVHTHEVSATIPLPACATFEYSVEYRRGTNTDWSCVGTGTLHGSNTARWNTINLSVGTTTNGVGGCNLMVKTPCNGNANPNENPDPNPPSAKNMLHCAISETNLAITVKGTVSQTLVNGPLNSIGFIAIGSDVTGWMTATDPPLFSIPYLGDSTMHVLTVPNSVHRFNLWAGGNSGARWFNLSEWTADGANCAIVPDGQGGAVVTR